MIILVQVYFKYKFSVNGSKYCADLGEQFRWNEKKNHISKSVEFSIS